MVAADSRASTTPPAQWPALRKQVVRRAARRNLLTLWPEAGKGGVALRWGLAAGCGAVSPAASALSRWAAGKQPPDDFDLADAAEGVLEALPAALDNLEWLAEVLPWAYAMPSLAAATESRFPESLWWRLLDELQAVQRHAAEQMPADSPAHLLAAGELGLVLAWQLSDLHSCASLRDSGLNAVRNWLLESGDAVAAAVGDGGRWVRLVLASGLRARRLANRFRKRFGVRKCGALIDLTSWAAALARPDGSIMLRESLDAKDDLGKRGLLAVAAAELGDEALRTAVDASLQRIKSNGKLAWRIELPEPGWCEEDAGLAVMLPEWDVRRGRLAVDFAQSTMQLELSGGRQPLLSGSWPAELRYEGTAVEPTGGWRELCWYSDDDVHYLELEQPFDGGLRLQRQLLLVRDDRCLMLADAVLGGEPEVALELRTHVELAPQLGIEESQETRELLLADEKQRALLLPMALGEWRVGPTAGECLVEDGPRGLVLRQHLRGSVALYQPLWIDLMRKRIRGQRTWRQLTVGEQRRLVPSHRAAAFRIHVHQDQWVVYRSLTGAANRTFLGKNLISDFYCGRFDSEDGTIEELVSVDEQPE